MYYNGVRFGSPFDFGANYNLTSNDMTLRGFRFLRLPDGFFSYLFQLPNLTLSFPFFKETSAAFIYPGRTIAEPMFGGVIAVFPFLWLLFRARKVYPVLRQKGLVTFALLPPVLALVVILADTEMAGILWRYTGDFLLLLYLGAVLIFLALLEDAKENERPRLLCFLVCTTFLTLLICLLISLESSQYLVRSPESYCRLKGFYELRLRPLFYYWVHLRRLL